MQPQAPRATDSGGIKSGPGCPFRLAAGFTGGRRLASAGEQGLKALFRMIHYSYILLEPLTSFESTEEIRRTFDLVKDCGYEGIELQVTRPLGCEVETLLRWITEAGLTVPSFLTGEAYHKGLCLSSPDKRVRQRTVDRLCEYVDIASAFDAILVVGLLQGLRSDEPDPQTANQRISDCLRDVAEAAHSQGVDLVLEPINHLQVGFNHTVAEVLQLVQEVDSPALLPMVDTVHMNIEEHNLLQPIRDCGQQLRHVHLCESNGREFGTGHINFSAVLDTLDEIGYDRFASVKIYRGTDLEANARTSLTWLKR